MSEFMSSRQNESMIVDGIIDRERAYQVTSEGFMIPMSDSLRRDVDDHIDDAEIRFSVVNRDRLLAGYALYESFVFEEGSVLYLSGVQIANSEQGKGITKELNKRAIELVNPDYFAFRTQSIRMFRSGTSIMSDFYPNLDSEQQIPDYIGSVGRQLAGKIGGVVPVSRGYYGGKSLYGERPTHKEDDNFYKTIDFENGDAVLCIGTIE